MTNTETGNAMLQERKWKNKRRQLEHNMKTLWDEQVRPPLSRWMKLGGFKTVVEEIASWEEFHKAMCKIRQIQQDIDHCNERIEYHIQRQMISINVRGVGDNGT